MKKNTMRIAAILLALVMVTMIGVGGTFAKYITRYTTYDDARVAYWGFENGHDTYYPGNNARINLFNPEYSNAENKTTVKSHNGTDLIYAPGTSGNADITFCYKDSKSGIKAPEVAYIFKLEADFCGSEAAEDGHMTYTLSYNGTTVVCRSEQQFVEELGKLTGMENVTVEQLKKTNEAGETYWTHHVVAQQEYAPGELPEFLKNNEKLNIAWEWVFENPENPDDLDWDNEDDELGNMNASMDKYDQMILELNITATQID